MKPIIFDAHHLLEPIQRLAGLFEFYPYGFSGLIADLIWHHVNYLDAGCVCDSEFLLRILDFYHDSPQYQAYFFDPESFNAEQAIHLALFKIFEAVWEFVRYNRKDLVNCLIDRETIRLGSAFEYILLERY